MEDETLLARDSLTLKPPLTKEMYIGESNADYYRNQVMICLTFENTPHSADEIAAAFIQ